MNTIRSFRAALVAALLALGSAAAVAQHAEKCDPIPKEEWKPQAELERKLANQGWKISRIKITNGCYEVYGRDEKNNGSRPSSTRRPSRS